MQAPNQPVQVRTHAQILPALGVLHNKPHIHTQTRTKPVQTDIHTHKLMPSQCRQTTLTHTNWHPASADRQHPHTNQHPASVDRHPHTDTQPVHRQHTHTNTQPVQKDNINTHKLTLSQCRKTTSTCKPTPSKCKQTSTHKPTPSQCRQTSTHKPTPSQCGQTLSTHTNWHPASADRQHVHTNQHPAIADRQHPHTNQHPAIADRQHVHTNQHPASADRQHSHTSWHPASADNIHTQTDTQPVQTTSTHKLTPSQCRQTSTHKLTTSQCRQTTVTHCAQDPRKDAASQLPELDVSYMAPCCQGTLPVSVTTCAPVDELGDLPHDPQPCFEMCLNMQWKHSCIFKPSNTNFEEGRNAFCILVAPFHSSGPCLWIMKISAQWCHADTSYFTHSWETCGGRECLIPFHTGPKDLPTAPSMLLVHHQRGIHLYVRVSTT